MLHNCGTCGERIAVVAVTCPKCGAPNAPDKKMSLMQSIWIVIGLLVLAAVGTYFYLGYSYERANKPAHLSSAFDNIKL